VSCRTAALYVARVAADIRWAVRCRRQLAKSWSSSFVAVCWVAGWVLGIAPDSMGYGLDVT
jgi:hypothetical protein